MTQHELLDHGPDLSQTGERIDALLTASATGGTVARERAEGSFGSSPISTGRGSSA